MIQFVMFLALERFFIYCKHFYFDEYFKKYRLTGKFLIKIKQEMSGQHISWDFNFNSPIYKDLTSEAVDLLKKTLEKNPSKRIKPFEALAHSYFKNFKNQNLETDEKFRAKHRTDQLFKHFLYMNLI